MSDNKVSMIISADAEKQAIQKLNEVKTVLNGLITLLPEERGVYGRMGERTVPFVQKAAEYGGRNAALVPVYVNLPELQKDLAAAQSLMRISRVILELQNMIDDTAAVAGFEAYTSALSIYKTTQEAARRNVPGAQEAYNDMQTRFPGRKPKAPDADAAK